MLEIVYWSSCFSFKCCWSTFFHFRLKRNKSSSVSLSVLDSCSIRIMIARLSQRVWTTKPKNFYHPNQLSTTCVIKSYWLTVLLGVIVQKRWLYLVNRLSKPHFAQLIMNQSAQTAQYTKAIRMAMIMLSL